VRSALVLLSLVLSACTGAAAGPASPVPTVPPPTFPEPPPHSVLADVRAAVDAEGRFAVLLVDDETALATDDRTWAATVRREGGTWRVAEVASLG
jgi:hypothetical protein